MELSIRRLFQKDRIACDSFVSWGGSINWESYVSWIGLPGLTEVRTGDQMLNECLGKPLLLHRPDDDVVSTLRSLPEIDGTRHYYLLAINLEQDILPTLPDGVTFLGYDIADETGISSLLNCGPWKGKLTPIVERLNPYGLLSLEDARLAQQLLPEEWGEEEPHAFVDIWALYDMTRLHSTSDSNATELQQELTQ